jgi:hypothetical protein
MPSPTIQVQSYALNQSVVYETVPGLIPASSTDVFTRDIHVIEVHLVNNSNAAVTVRVRDKQSTPMPILPDDLSIDANSVIDFAFSGRLAPGGVTWSASSGTAIIGFIRAY